MAYAEIKSRCGGAKGCKEWAISRGLCAPSTTARRASRTDDDTVYSPLKISGNRGYKGY
nr:MAG TPA: hypothetical protein [Bacteriophage sp.]